eukprot:14112708-Alexandrium_andersonii.AAC.1
MSASLVGSEMCIRDSSPPVHVLVVGGPTTAVRANKPSSLVHALVLSDPTTVVHANKPSYPCHA